MRDLLSWNLSLGRWLGVQVRLHVFFVLLAGVVLHFSAEAGLLWYGASSLLILFCSALLHELGHCFAAEKVGGAAEQILLWPLGGLAHINVSQEPHSELVTALAGPIVNLAVCVLLMAPLVATHGDLFALLNPLDPPAAVDGFSWVELLQMAFWLNWLLLLVNLLPAFPLDGGRALRALLWQRYGFRTAVLLVVRSAKVLALLLCLAAWLVHEHYSYAVLPLFIVAIFLYFSAKQEAERLHDQDTGDGFFGYDFSQGYTSLEKQFQPSSAREPGPFKRWLETRRRARLERQRQQEEDEERRVDEILARLHEVGREGLSEDDRALLDRVSERYRNRQRG